MKICIINHSYPPQIGGGETVVFELANELNQRGNEVTVITGGNKLEEISIIQENNLQIIRLGNFYKFEKGIITLQQFLPQFRVALSNSVFDVVHIHNFMPGLAFSVLSYLITCKVVFTFHSGPSENEGRVIGAVPEWESDFALAKFILKQKFYSSVICPSKFYFNWGEKLGIDKNDLELIYHGVNISKFNKKKDSLWRKKNNYKNDDFIIVCPARMVKRKGITDLIEAIHLVRQSEVKLFIASSLKSGSEYYAREVTNTINKYDLNGNVTIAYDTYFIDDIPQLLTNCDALVLPSHTEGFGMVLIEGMAAGLPVIGSRVGGITEIIQHEKNGLLFESKNIKDLANKIKTLINNKDLANTLSQNGLKLVKSKFNFCKQVDKYLQIYTE